MHLWLKRILLAGLVLLVLVLLAALGGVAWVAKEARTNLEPPANPPGQRSIAAYAPRLPEQTVDAVDLRGDFRWDDILDPPKSARPWTRWWWPGGAVEPRTLLTQLGELDAAGFGGAEIQPFAIGLGAVTDSAALDRVYSFDSPAYYRTLHALMREAAQLHWQLDLTHFSGWPAGGPEINLEDGLQELAYAELTVEGGQALTLALPRPEPGPSKLLFGALEGLMGDFVNFPADQAQLLSVIAARRSGGARSLNPLNLGDTQVLDADSVTILTPDVTRNTLVWNAPPGQWTIIASYLIPAGEVPINGAQKPRGFVVDHLRKPQVLGHYEYAFGERTGLPDAFGKGFRGVFNDSLEFRLNRMGAADILEEFKTRRGYDLEPLLPAVYIEGADNMYFREVFGLHAAPDFQLSPLDERVRHDFNLTLSDLLIERFVETSANWAQSRGLVSRGQSYGMDIDILRALGANTIPETEQLWAGGSDLVLKMASSAAAIYGRPLVSSESFVWEGRDFTTTARKLKAAADKLLLAGINHIVYHGTPYPWRGGTPDPFGPEGWTPFSGPKNQAHFSSIVAPGNTQLWPDMPQVNSYITRSQYLLRQGVPDVDVLVYYPFLGFDGRRDRANERNEALLNGSIPDADPRAPLPDMLQSAKPALDAIFSVASNASGERERWTQQMIPLLQELDRRGITWNWVNSHGITSGKLGAGLLPASSGHYGAILLSDIRAIEPATLRKLIAFAADGTPVFFAGDTPRRQPGFKDAIEGDRAVLALVEAAPRAGVGLLPGDATQLGVALQQALAQPVSYSAQSRIKTYRRSLGEGQTISFFANQSAGPESLPLVIQEPEQAWWYDPVQGVAWPAIASGGKLHLQLQGFSSRFLISGVPIPEEVPTRVSNEVLLSRAERRHELTGWLLEVDGRRFELDTLADWRDIPELALRSRPGSYTHGFSIDGSDPNTRYLLDLGLVQGSAQVKVNGELVSRSSIPPFITDISEQVKAGENRLEVIVSPPLRNGFIGRGLQDDPQYEQMKGFVDQTVAAGLIGPVLIVAVHCAVGEGEC